jgi:hypothetical protein
VAFAAIEIIISDATTRSLSSPPASATDPHCTTADQHLSSTVAKEQPQRLL